MNKTSEDFNYDSWAEEQIRDKKRESILLWKAEQMASLVPYAMSFDAA